MSRTQPEFHPEPRWIELDTSLAETEAVDDWDGGRVDLETERPLEEVGEDRSWVKPLVLCLSPLAAFVFGGLLVLVIPRSPAVPIAVEPEHEAALVPPMPEVDEAPRAPVGAALPPVQSSTPEPTRAAPVELEAGVSEPVLASIARVHRPPPPPHFDASASPNVDPAAASTRSGAERRSAAEPSPSPATSGTQFQAEGHATVESSEIGPSDVYEPPLPGATPAPVSSDASPSASPESADPPANSSSDPTSVYADLPEYPS